MAGKTFYRITTHLRVEWRWAYSARQAAYLVYLEYRKTGFDWAFLECCRAWSVAHRID